MTGLVATAAAVGSGLVGGVFLAFSAAVMPALARLPPATAVAVMQAVNTEIVRSVFVAVFLGTAVASVAAAVLEHGAARTVVGAALYVVGAFGVTMVANVPLNTALAAADPAEPAQAWRRYAARWTRWNHVRTLAAAAAAVALIG